VKAAVWIFAQITMWAAQVMAIVCVVDGDYVKGTYFTAAAINVAVAAIAFRQVIGSEL
jgi:hypothetical protein